MMPQVVWYCDDAYRFGYGLTDVSEKKCIVLTKQLAIPFIYLVLAS